MPYQNKPQADPEFVLTINLSDFVGTQTVSFNGQNGLFIPYDCNPCIFVGQKKIMVDMKAFRKDPPGDRGESHYLRPQIRKDIQLSREQAKQYTNIIGNMTPFSVIIGRANQQKGGYAPQGGYQQGGYQQAPGPQYPPQYAPQQPQGGYAPQAPQVQQYPAQQGGYQNQGYVPQQPQQGGYRQQAPQPQQGGSAGYGKPAPAAPQGGYAPRAPQVPPTPAPPVYGGEDMPEGI